MDPDYLAKECEFLAHHDVLQYILDEMRAEAVETLLTTDNADYMAIAEHQARALVVDHLRGLFKFHMEMAGTKKPGSVV